MELSSLKKLNKTPLGETGWLGKYQNLLVPQAYHFLIHPPSLIDLPSLTH